LDVSDLEIIKLYRSNKHKGLEVLYGRYKKYVYTIAYNFTGNKEDALDITQEIFVTLFRSLERFDEEFSLLPYIKRIAVNRCLNFKRDEKKQVSLNQTDEDGNEMQNKIPAAQDTEKILIWKDTKKSLENAVMKLTKEERVVVLLRHMKGMKYEEISKVMNVPLGTVKTYIYRARKNLKNYMVEDGLWEV
jgi:RNA polymerase sigma factor (sigma-70 family)